jgi:hypothetical protein
MNSSRCHQRVPAGHHKEEAPQIRCTGRRPHDDSGTNSRTRAEHVERDGGEWMRMATVKGAR